MLLAFLVLTLLTAQHHQERIDPQELLRAVAGDKVHQPRMGSISVQAGNAVQGSAVNQSNAPARTRDERIGVNR